MAVGACRFASDPLACAARQGGDAVQRGRHLQAHPGRAAHHAGDKAQVDLACLIGEQSDIDRDAGFAQALQALACHPGVGIDHRGDHAGHTLGHQQVGAGGGAAVVGAGFQCDVGRGALQDMAVLPGLFHRLDFGMILSRRQGRALAEHLAVSGATDVTALRRRVKALAKENASYWRKTTREPGAENAIVAEALDRLAGLGLVRVEGTGPEAVVRPLPALRRFALAAPTIAERNAR